MKKITLLIALMLFAFANAQQQVIENFEASSTYTIQKFEGLADAVVGTDPVTGGTRGNVLRMVSVSTGNPWQGAEVIFTGTKVRLTTDKTMKIDVYSTQAFTLLAKAEVGATASATSANYTTPNEWQTLTFNFANAYDNTAAANGEYGKIVFFPNWKSTNNGFNSPANFTLHIDNITGEKVVTAPAFVPVAAPTPTTPNAQVFSLYGDTGGFTNKWIPDYSFGGPLGRPDLDPTEGVNEAIKMNFSTQGYGEGLDPAAPRKDVSSYGFLNFDYYIQGGDVNPAGSLGHQFYIDLISRIGTTNTEGFYGIGSTILKTGGASEQVAKLIVFDAWQTVSIPMSEFVGGFSPANFFQFKLGSSSDLRSKVVFFDNIYFSVNNPSLSTASFNTSNVKMYPNPVTDHLMIEANSTIEKVAVYNILGQEVMSESPKNNSTMLQTNDLQKGVYIVKTTIDGTVNSSKIIKQ